MNRQPHVATASRRLRAITALALGFSATLAPAQPPQSWLGWMLTLERQKEVRPVVDPDWRRECGECHLAYPPGLLPARSWQALLAPDALRAHFGVNAELAPTMQVRLLALAREEAADQAWAKRSRKIAAATASGPAPLRISEVRTIARAHAAVAEDVRAQRFSVPSMAACERCHAQADDGVFDAARAQVPTEPR